MGWKQVTSEAEGRKMLSDMTNTDTPAPAAEFDMSTISPGSLLFAREVGSFLLNIYVFICTACILISLKMNSSHFYECYTA